MAFGQKTKPLNLPPTWFGTGRTGEPWHSSVLPLSTSLIVLKGEPDISEHKAGSQITEYPGLVEFGFVTTVQTMEATERALFPFYLGHKFRLD